MNAKQISQEKLDQIEQQLLDACEKAQARGMSIISNYWSLLSRNTKYAFGGYYCCPNAALLVCNNVLPSGTSYVDCYVDDIARYLQVSRDFVLGFISGFDGYPYQGLPCDWGVGHTLGAKFRKRFAK